MKRIASLLACVLLLAISTCCSQTSTSSDLRLINLGVTWCDDRLVMFDPYAGTAVDTGVVVSASEERNCFRGLTLDSDHNQLYALAQISFALYSISPASGVVKDLGRLDLSGAGLSNKWARDIGGLAYRPDHGLYTTVTGWDMYYQNPESAIVQIDLDTRQVTPVATLTGYTGSLVWDANSQSFLGYSTPCSRDCVPSMFQFDPATHQVSIMFEVNWYPVSGLAPSKHAGRFISWGGHAYLEVDTSSGSITPLGQADGVKVWSDAMMTMDSKRFQILK